MRSEIRKALEVQRQKPRTKINWRNREERCAYKAAYSRDSRYAPRPKATALAKQVLANEVMRAVRGQKAKPVSEGNEEWKKLAAKA